MTLMEGLQSQHVALPCGLRVRCLSNERPLSARGTATLFVHGWPSLAWSWRAQLRVCPTLAVALDLPGFGESDRSDDPATWSQRRLVATVLELVGALGLQRVFLVGHGAGREALRLAAGRSCPHRLGRRRRVERGLGAGRSHRGSGLAVHAAAARCGG